MLLYSNSIRSNNSNHPMIFLWKSTNCKTPPNHPDSEVQVGQTPKTRWHTGRHWTLSQPLDFWSIYYESQLKIRQVSRLANIQWYSMKYLDLNCSEGCKPFFEARLRRRRRRTDFWYNYKGAKRFFTPLCCNHATCLLGYQFSLPYVWDFIIYLEFTWNKKIK